ncbi:MAG: serine/threonine protein kinase [Firmicutes bacterium]|nr:serine/threonine protein kinase [Bacillota bacterium]
MDYSIGSSVLDKWVITRLIGEGAYGKVFEIEKSKYGVTTRSALKVIRVPHSPGDLDAVMSEGMDEVSATAYFRGFVDEIVQEIAIMSSLKSHPHIVSCEDYEVIPHENELGWDILIRMELLTSLISYQKTHTMDAETVRRMGMELADALEYCEGKGLIHRDIKPENIFVSDTGIFKLGDFGVARTVEKTTGGMSKKGTESYMAPEVYKGLTYNATVDIYSLGLVLYRYLNGNRLPFFPAPPQPITYADRENAIAKRMQGVAMPMPSGADEALGLVALKACAFDPKKRYQSGAEMRAALQSVGTTAPETVYNEAEEPTVGIWSHSETTIHPSGRPTDDFHDHAAPAAPAAPAAEEMADQGEHTFGIWGGKPAGPSSDTFRDSESAEPEQGSFWGSKPAEPAKEYSTPPPVATGLQPRYDNKKRFDDEEPEPEPTKPPRRKGMIIGLVSAAAVLVLILTIVLGSSGGRGSSGHTSRNASAVSQTSHNNISKAESVAEGVHEIKTAMEYNTFLDLYTDTDEEMVMETYLQGITPKMDYAVGVSMFVDHPEITGAYVIYDGCSAAQGDKLRSMCPGGKVRVQGKVKLVGGSWWIYASNVQFIEDGDTYVAQPVEVPTSPDGFFYLMNDGRQVVFRNVEITERKDGSPFSGFGFDTYYSNSGSLYFSGDAGFPLSFEVNSNYNNGSLTTTNMARGLKIGDHVDITCLLQTSEYNGYEKSSIPYLCPVVTRITPVDEDMLQLVTPDTLTVAYDDTLEFNNGKSSLNYALPAIQEALLNMAKKLGLRQIELFPISSGSQIVSGEVKADCMLSVHGWKEIYTQERFNNYIENNLDSFIVPSPNGRRNNATGYYFTIQEQFDSYSNEMIYYHLNLSYFSSLILRGVLTDITKDMLDSGEMEQIFKNVSP